MTAVDGRCALFNPARWPSLVIAWAAMKSLHRSYLSGWDLQLLEYAEWPLTAYICSPGEKSCWFFNNTWESLLKRVEFDSEHFIMDVSGKYPQLWALKGAHPVNVNRWYKFGALASIRTVAPGFREISELPD
ncbi:hypothetical protein ACS0TY_026864 [Phlomoides rotata]